MNSGKQTIFTIVKECNRDLAGGGKLGTIRECGWEELLILVDQITLFCIYLCAILGTLSIAYAGWLMLSSVGNPSKVEKAKKVFGKVIWGIIIVLIAYLLVKFILNLMGLEQAYSLLELK